MRRAKDRSQIRREPLLLLVDADSADALKVDVTLSVVTRVLSFRNQSTTSSTRIDGCLSGAATTTRRLAFSTVPAGSTAVRHLTKRYVRRPQSRAGRFDGGCCTLDAQWSGVCVHVGCAAPRQIPITYSGASTRAATAVCARQTAPSLTSLARPEGTGRTRRPCTSSSEH
jgi:hypothetical protein